MQIVETIFEEGLRLGSLEVKHCLIEDDRAKATGRSMVMPVEITTHRQDNW